MWKVRCCGVPLLLALVVLSFPVSGFAQEQDPTLEETFEEMLGQWKRNFTAPSYGVSLIRFKVEQKQSANIVSDFGGEDFFVPAMDLRIFRGVNISKRGGFYTGVEVGVLVLLGGSETLFDSITLTDPEVPGPFDYFFDYDIEIEPHGESIFLMARYGYRADVGKALMGFSVGFDIGFGGALNYMGYDFFIEDFTGTRVDAGSGADEARFGIVAEASLEAAFRFGKNFRMFLKPGIMVLPVEFKKDEDFPMGPDIFNDGINPNSDNEYLEYAVGNYNVEMEFLLFNIRAGFSLNFN
jgi:hypothetical protein